MKKNYMLPVFLLILVLAFGMTACGGGSDETTESGEPAAEETAEVTEDNTEAEEEAESTAAPAAKEDVVVNTDEKTVTITAQLNGAFFDQSTMHYCVFKDGSMGDRCMFAAYCSADEFYSGMLEAGGEPGTKTKEQIEGGELIDGQKVAVTVLWDGADGPVDIADTVKTAEGKPDIDMRFSDNLQGNKDCGSGCICCLNSCWAGIVSNGAYAFGAVDSGNPSIYLDDSVMPADGTDVQITFALQ